MRLHTNQEINSWIFGKSLDAFTVSFYLQLRLNYKAIFDTSVERSEAQMLKEASKIALIRLKSTFKKNSLLRSSHLEIIDFSV